jgi:hypothetical protein
MSEREEWGSFDDVLIPRVILAVFERPSPQVLLYI